MFQLLTNYPLWAALFAIFFAQSAKIPFHYWTTKEWKPSMLFSSGGMPSSHSAAVSALTTALAIREGLDSNWFAISAVFAVIVMYDAAGIRRHAGRHAKILNRLVMEFYHLFDGKHWEEKRDPDQPQLKELLGHQPIEVLGGAVTGVLSAFLLSPIF